MKGGILLAWVLLVAVVLRIFKAGADEDERSWMK